MKKQIISIVCCAVLTGCAYSGQKFVDESYEEGFLTRRVVGKSKTIAPPLGAKAIASHDLDMIEDLDGWKIRMGSKDDLVGGEISPDILRALSTLVAP